MRDIQGLGCQIDIPFGGLENHDLSFCAQGSQGRAPLENSNHKERNLVAAAMRGPMFLKTPKFSSHTFMVLAKGKHFFGRAGVAVIAVRSTSKSQREFQPKWWKVFGGKGFRK